MPCCSSCSCLFFVCLLEMCFDSRARSSYLESYFEVICTFRRLKKHMKLLRPKPNTNYKFRAAYLTFTLKMSINTNYMYQLMGCWNEN